MKGLQIFMHSIRQVTGNLSAALKVSGLLYAVQFVLGQFFGRSLGDQAQMRAAMEQGNYPFLSIFLVLLVTLLTSVWIAVGWHRYVLREEQPGILPAFLGDRFLGYFGKSLLIGLIMIPIAFILGFIATIILRPFAQEGPTLLLLIITGLVVYLPIGVVAMRLSTILPGVALEPGQSLWAGWVATKGETASFVALVLLSLAMALVLNLPSLYLFDFGSGLALVWNFVVGWFITMIGVSILTTLYGHYIEKRPLL